MKATFETARECRVETCRWYGAFIRAYVDVPGDLDVYHLVPLKNTHLSRGWRWDLSRRTKYANYLQDPDHLIAIASRANRSKGAREPEDRKPFDETYWSQYATDWTKIKARWNLTMTELEAEAVALMLGTREDPPEVVTVVEFLTSLGTATGEHKPEPEPELQNSVYGSFDEAESAGEERVQGSQGGGRGFPKATVPSARDGDGDGIVCER